VIDHILLDVIGALKESLEGALLEQQSVEERFQIDVFLGDVSFETSYSLPGEHNPPRVRADLSLEWPTWSQSAYRSWSIGEPPAERPEIIVEVALRLQRLASAPAPTIVIGALGTELPHLGVDNLERSGPTVEQVYDHERPVSAAVEVAYQGVYRLEEAVLESPEKLEPELQSLARWIASSLVRLADLDLPFLPAEESDVSD